MKKSPFKTMCKLIALLKPLIPVMIVAVVTGVLGFLASILIPVLGSVLLLVSMDMLKYSYKAIIYLIIVSALARGVLRYIEQESNHYIAFKILAIIRDKVFASLRKLCPAKLETKDKGSMLTIITRDIEMLEVFYAHTISPVCIAVILSVIMTVFQYRLSPYFALISAIAYISIGAIVPQIMSSISSENAAVFARKFSDINSFFLESLKGIRQSIQYDTGRDRLEEFKTLRSDMEKSEKILKKDEGRDDAVNGLMVYIFSIIDLLVGMYLVKIGQISFAYALISLVSIFSSFGAVIAVSRLGTGLGKTIASGDRVLELLSEEPLIEDVIDGRDIEFSGAELKDLNFSYDEEMILEDLSLEIKKGKVLGIIGKSGSGKSTMLKLLMRFWDRDSGDIRISGEDIKNINTSSLRDIESYLTQETVLFNDTVENNIKIASLSATHEEVVEAAKKASVHEFIEKLPKGYESNIGEFARNISEGEKQRIGLARAFLHNADLILLDEPTSNIDSLNEAVILKAIKDLKDKTVVIVSHRPSTVTIADETVKIDSGRVS